MHWGKIDMSKLALSVCSLAKTYYVGTTCTRPRDMRTCGPETKGPKYSLEGYIALQLFGRLQKVAADARSPHCCYADRRHYSLQKTLLLHNTLTPLTFRVHTIFDLQSSPLPVLQSQTCTCKTLPLW